MQQLKKKLFTLPIYDMDIDKLLTKYSLQNITELQSHRGHIESMKHIIEDCFGATKLNEIIHRLRDTVNDNNNDAKIRKWAKRQYEKIMDASPLSMSITMKVIQSRKYNASIATHACINYIIGVRLLNANNFYLGVRQRRAKKDKQEYKRPINA